MRLALVVAVVTAGCLPGGGGSPKVFDHVHSSGGSSGGGARLCAIYPHLWASWQAPAEIPPSCPYEGWVRQVVRDTHDLDACATLAEPELRIVLRIDEHGVLTRVEVAPSISMGVRRCVNHALRAWEFASSAAAGTILVIYRPGP